MVGKKIIIYFNDLSFGWLIDEKISISLTQKCNMEQLLCECHTSSENINPLMTDP
jgi:hypothetical protein